MTTLILPTPPKLNISNLHSYDQKKQNQSWHGHLYSVLLDNLTSLSGIVKTVAFHILNPFKLVFSSIGPTTSLLKKAQRHIIPAIEKLKNLPNHFEQLTNILDSSVNLINTVQIAAGIDYIANAKFKKDNKPTALGKILLFASHISQGLLWAGRHGHLHLQSIATAIADVRVFSFVQTIVQNIPALRNFTNLQSLALSMGNIRIFSIVSSIKLPILAGTMLAAAHILFAADASSKFLLTQDPIRQTYLGIEIAKNAIEFTLAMIMMGSFLSTPYIGAISGICIVLELTSLIYKERHDGNLSGL